MDQGKHALHMLQHLTYDKRFKKANHALMSAIDTAEQALSSIANAVSTTSRDLSRVIAEM